MAEAGGVNLSVSVTLVFGCVVFYTALLLSLSLRRSSRDEGSATPQGGSVGG